MLYSSERENDNKKTAKKPNKQTKSVNNEYHIRKLIEVDVAFYDKKNNKYFVIQK